MTPWPKPNKPTSRMVIIFVWTVAVMSIGFVAGWLAGFASAVFMGLGL